MFNLKVSKLYIFILFVDSLAARVFKMHNVGQRRSVLKVLYSVADPDPGSLKNRTQDTAEVLQNRKCEKEFSNWTFFI